GRGAEAPRQVTTSARTTPSQRTTAPRSDALATNCQFRSASRNRNRFSVSRSPPPVVQARCMGTERLPSPPERSAGGYTATEAARPLATTAARIHAWVRAGFVEPARGPRNEWRFSFQDLVVLRVAQNLAEQLPAARVKRALTRLREQLPTGRGLASVRLSV